MKMGTNNSSAFHDQPKPTDPSKRDILFNGPGDGNIHGHVVTQGEVNGQVNYVYVRDVEGNVYRDNR
jgi:hypothetical protein